MYSLFSKKKLHFIYGRWTDFLKCTDINSYDEYFKENSQKFKSHDDRSKSPSESPAHSRKVFSKLKSSFRSLSIQDDPEPTPTEQSVEGDMPKSHSVYSIDIPNSVSLWEVDPRPENSANFFQFTSFAMSLNEMESHHAKVLCPTDSRLRPDIRKLEEGDTEGASLEKTRLEEKQRDAKKDRKSKEKKGEDWDARWFKFEANPHTKQDDWLFSGKYWDRNYEKDLDLF